MSNQGNMSDLWKRLRFVLFAILVYRIGTHIPIPGINPTAIAGFFAENEDGTILQMFNLFSGGALERMSIFALNVVPYISSAIIMQLFSNSIPYLQELKRMVKLEETKLHNIQDTGQLFWHLFKHQHWQQHYRLAIWLLLQVLHFLLPLYFQL